MKVVTSIKIDEEVKRGLKIMAMDEKTTVSNLIELLYQKYSQDKVNIERVVYYNKNN